MLIYFGQTRSWLRLLALGILLLSGSLYAQKFGHLNSDNLLAIYPETKHADRQLENYQASLGAQFEKKVKAFKKDAAIFLEKAQNAQLSQAEIQQQQKALADRERALTEEEKDLQKKVQDKRQSLLKPILAKVNAAIKQVGEEGNYDMIFDTSLMNATLFVRDSDDVMPLVKRKLGIQ